MEIKFIGLGIVIDETLIISDVHIGYEETLNKQGILVPRVYFKEQLLMLKKLLKKVNPTRVVINGDLKHEFGKISETEWRNTLKFLDAIGDREIILIKGNHDKIVEPIAKKRNVMIVDFYKIGDILITHGDKIIEEKAETIIIGHVHPAISIRDNARVETYKCYLSSDNLIVQPSFNMVTMGTDILKDDLLSPYLIDIDDFKITIVEKGQLLEFGKISELR
jgi:hypothetical protein